MAVCIVAVWLTLAQAGISGVVVDASGAAVVGARVTAHVDGTDAASVVTGADGRFSFDDLRPGDTFLRVTSPGFASVRLHVAAGGDPPYVVLQPAALFESVTVTASRGSDRLITPASTVVLSSAQLTTFAAPAVDDRLRGTAGFELTRRSSSRVANPSSQGVSMRGLPGNAGSRTLVLADGLPLNDMFGGWVYWNRVPDAAVDRIEVVRGAAGDLYGGDAVSGVIQLFTLAPARPTVRATIDVGSPRTTRASLFAGTRAAGWTIAAGGERVDTDGVPIVAAAERGPVDVPATSNYTTSYTTARYAAGAWHVRGRFGAYQEVRGNGTPLVTNDTNWRQGSGDAAGQAAGGTWTAQLSTGRQRYFNNFSSVPGDRKTERVTSAQRLPSEFATFSAQWVRPWRSHVFLAGSEGRRTEASVEEIRYAPTGAVTGPFVTGGIERVVSGYGRAALSVAKNTVVVTGVRADFWRSMPREADAPTHAVNFVSPRASVAWQPSSGVGLHASATHAYRTPTLDELHRSSRVGNTATSGNPLLEPERFTGVEGGVLLNRGRASARVSAFRGSLTDAITNVTLASTPALITKQKQNADHVVARGIEIDADVRPAAGLRLNASAVLTSSRFRDEVKNPALEGKRVPQIPRYQLAAGVTFTDPRTVTAAVQVRASGEQYEDDLNQLPLKAFTVVDAYVNRAIGRRLQAFVAVENVFDVEYQTGRTPVTKIGWPRSGRAGVRVVLP